MADISQITAADGITYDIKDEVARNRVIDYNNVTNKPMINGVALEGDKALTDFGVVPVGDLTQFQNPDGTLKAEVIEGFINGAMAQLVTQYDVAEHSDKIAILFENLDSTSPTYGALAIGTQGLMISKTRENDDWVWTTALTSNGLITDIIAVHSIGANKLDGSITNGNWVLDFTDGTFTIGEIAANKITAGQITAAITATNLTMTGGSIDMTTSTSSNDMIKLRGTGGYYFQIGNCGWEIVNSSGNTVAYGYLGTDQQADISIGQNGTNQHVLIEGSSGCIYAAKDKWHTATNSATNRQCGLDMNNSDINNINAIYAADEATSPGEGINWVNGTGSTWDSLWANGGVLYFCPENTGSGTDKKAVWHKGNALQSFREQTNLGTDGQNYKTGVWGNQGYVDFGKGTYLIMFFGMFANNSTGRRIMLLNTASTGTAPSYASAIDTRMAVNGAATRLSFSTILTFNSPTTLYLNAYQNSGGDLGFTCRYAYLKLF